MTTKRKRTITTDESTESEEEGPSPAHEPVLKVKIKPKRRKKAKSPPPGANSDSESEKEDLSPARRTQKTKPSRLQQQKLRARKCPNMQKIKTKNGIMVVRKQIPFKKKNKPGLGERKEYKRGDMMVITRSQDRKYLGKLIRPVVSGEYLQPRLGFADRHLQPITHPPLKESRWIPRDDATGTPGYMEIDPRRRESFRWLRKLIKVLRQQDHYLNPDMRAHVKKKKKEIHMLI
jgi:hypothetical protein